MPVQDWPASKLAEVRAVHGEAEVVGVARKHIDPLDFCAAIKQHIPLALARQLDFVSLFGHLRDFRKPQRRQERLRRLKQQLLRSFDVH